jgi:ADP-ribosylglycohydrolase
VIEDFDGFLPPQSHSFTDMTDPSDIVLGSLIGDALALGPHWIYDHGIIRQKFGHVKTYQAPITTYHAGKTAGDLTHYGDQTLVLLRSIFETGGFDLVRFANAWQAFWEDPATHAYRDGATKTTLAHLKSGAPASTSDEIAGAARIGPLFLLKWKNDDALIAAARAQTGFTHGDPSTVEVAEFFTQVTLAVRRGKDIRTALEKTMKLDHRKNLLGEWFDNAIESAASAESDAAELNRHGLSCHTEDAFPGICHLLLRYPLDPATALIENVCAGGDSAARGMILGLIYGACVPVSTWPAEWLTDLHARVKVDALIDKLG